MRWTPPATIVGIEVPRGSLDGITEPRKGNRVREWCRRCRHEPLAAQQRQLSRRLRGHYGYYGITGNFRALDNFYRQVTREWRKWLDRRSGKRSMPWERFAHFLGNFPLPRPKIVHAV